MQSTLLVKPREQSKKRKTDLYHIYTSSKIEDVSEILFET